jgi:hypothetical protein
MSREIEAALRANQPCGTTVLASAGYHEPSLVFLLGTKTILTNVDGTAQHLLADPACALALAPVGEEKRLDDLLAGQGRSANRVARIDGVNYSSGEKMSLGLYRIAD